MISIEHDQKWLNKFPNIEYIHAPIRRYKPTRWHGNQDQWYDTQIVKRVLADRHYDLLLIDGPPANFGRGGILKYKDLIDPSVPVIIDDINRPAEFQIARVLSGHRNEHMVLPPLISSKQFAIIGSKEVLVYLGS